jgi:hypothetical protein
MQESHIGCILWPRGTSRHTDGLHVAATCAKQRLARRSKDMRGRMLFHIVTRRDLRRHLYSLHVAVACAEQHQSNPDV